ncbi:MAG: restriction endonuclease subunit S [Defluviicoccus sp.]|nr:restriction endonuclease subunit S [Defluviicoccus sp.]MDE0384109.1 restriction endonuclease subunit S [Defluviicoccus sp.]
MTAALLRYPEMKESGLDWLGLVPAHWDVEPLGRFGSFSTGRGGNRLDERASGIPCIRYGDLYTTHRRFVTESRSFVTRSKAAKYSPIRFGDVLFAATGETAAEVGESAVNLIRSEACCGRDVIRFRPSRTVDARYLGYATNCLPAAGQKGAMGQGITVAHIYAEQLKRLTVTLPPLDEQGAIVRFLDRVERRMRNFVRAKKRLVALLEEQKLVTVHRAVAGKLDVRTGRPYRVCKDSGAAWLGMVPEHWVVERLKASMASVGRICDERRHVDAYVALEHVESRTGRLQRGEPDDPPDARLRRFEPGDVLFGKLRPHLARVVSPQTGGLCAGEFLVLRPRRSAFSGRYVERLLRSHPVVAAIDALAGGSAVKRAEWSGLGCLRIVRPPLAEQHAIVSYLERVEAAIDARIARAKRQIELAAELHARLIADVVTGKRDVRGAPVTLAELVSYAVGGNVEDALHSCAQPEPARRLAG